MNFLPNPCIIEKNPNIAWNRNLNPMINMQKRYHKENMSDYKYFSASYSVVRKHRDWGIVESLIFPSQIYFNASKWRRTNKKYWCSGYNVRTEMNRNSFKELWFCIKEDKIFCVSWGYERIPIRSALQWYRKSLLGTRQTTGL